MAVTKCTITGIDYWRVYRRWGGETAQRYFRVDQPDERTSYKKALAEDESLRQRQWAYQSRQAFDLNFHIQPDGRLRGVRRVTRTRKNRVPTEVFEVRIKLPWGNKPVFTSVSIDEHGVDEAFYRVVERYCDEYGFDERSVMRSALRQCLAAYKSALKLQALPETLTEDTSDGWSELEREIAEYQARDRKLIVGR